MKSIALCVRPIALIVVACWSAHAQLAVTLQTPTVTFDKAIQQYLPSPIPVTITLRNTGASPTPPLSVRLSIPPPLALDSAENGAVIKVPNPAVIPAGDSAIVVWHVRHPLSFTSRIVRVTVWVRRGASDSSSHVTNLMIPPADSPILSAQMLSVPDLAVRPDSLGYANNPFEVRVGLMNIGGTEADSVRLQLQLPQDCILDPPGQSNPVLMTGPLPPQSPSEPRREYAWTVRYTASTRTSRSDSAVVSISGKDLAGGAISARVSDGFSIAGLAPKFMVNFGVPDSVRFDPQSVYDPNPVEAMATVQNTSLQTFTLQTVAFTAGGEGFSILEPLNRSIGTLAPGETKSFSWHLLLERAPVPREILPAAEVTDGDGFAVGAGRRISVPGKPFSLNIVDLDAPDTLHLNAAGNEYDGNPFEVSYRILNNSWIDADIRFRSITVAGVAISPPGPVTDTTRLPLSAEATSAIEKRIFHATGSSIARSVTFIVTAVSDEGDTAVGSSSLFLPAISPEMTMTRAGVDSLRYDPITKYAPNPHEQRFTVRNTSRYPVRFDSLVLDWEGEGVTSPQDRSVPYFQILPPDGTEQAAWLFTVEPREDSRALRLHARAYFERGHSVELADSVFIPGLTPGLNALAEGIDSLQYDAVATYAPNPFPRSVRILNEGTAPLALDSAVLVCGDNSIGVTPARRLDIGSALLPGDTLRFEWALEAIARTDSSVVPIDIVIYHSGGKSLPLGCSVFIPGWRTRFAIQDVQHPDSLGLLPSGDGYDGNPVAVSYRALNDSWTNTALTGSRFEVTGEGVDPLSPGSRVHNVLLQPGQISPAVTDTFFVQPRAYARVIGFRAVCLSARGDSAVAAGTIAIPAVNPTAVDPAPSNRAISLDVHPNPLASAGQTLSIDFTLSASAVVSLRLCGVSGECIDIAQPREMNPGAHRIEWSVSELPPGMYLLRMGAGRDSAVRSVVLVR